MPPASAWCDKAEIKIETNEEAKNKDHQIELDRVVERLVWKREVSTVEAQYNHN